MQAVEKQYPSNDYQIKQPLPVLFQDDKEIDIDYPRGSNGWLIAKTCSGHSVCIYIVKSMTSCTCSSYRLDWKI